ncbi:hypothetical protein [Psychromarinibacter halotolerans]|uniref:Uncharacterized protein n=1 Tax=Psychromarinibacter halotolerans TaxID=1775175 RepID=A0ABV7GLF9_9RHOB|nr:hypothetical protein [Psychromarinibacter halotolerans]MAQ83754.1 hypothetical protein [Maritimibacter sp.]MDF0597710.1 hypothetical protein [Psychromarinibacter halotolerans]
MAMSSADLYLVLGLILATFAVPSLLGAFADRRRPWVAVLVFAIGAGMVGVALSRQSYTLHGVPEAFVRVVAYFVR